MGYTIGRVFKKEEIVSNVDTDQSESVVKADSDIEQTDIEQTDDINSDNSQNDETEVPVKTTRRGRKKE